MVGMNRFFDWLLLSHGGTIILLGLLLLGKGSLLRVDNSGKVDLLKCSGLLRVHEHVEASGVELFQHIYLLNNYY